MRRMDRAPLSLADYVDRQGSSSHRRTRTSRELVGCQPRRLRRRQPSQKLGDPYHICHRRTRRYPSYTPRQMTPERPPTDPVDRTAQLGDWSNSLLIIPPKPTLNGPWRLHGQAAASARCNQLASQTAKAMEAKGGWHNLVNDPFFPIP